MKKCQGVWAPSGDRSIRSSIGRRSSGWGFVPCGSFPCGFGAKNKLRESKTARKIGRVKELGGSELLFPVPCRSLVFLRSETTPKRLLNRLPCGLSEYRSAGSFHEKRLVIEQSSPDIHTLEKLKQMDERKRTFETRKTKAACVFGW